MNGQIEWKWWGSFSLSGFIDVVTLIYENHMFIQLFPDAMIVFKTFLQYDTWLNTEIAGFLIFLSLLF